MKAIEQQDSLFIFATFIKEYINFRQMEKSQEQKQMQIIQLETVNKQEKEERKTTIETNTLDNEAQITENGQIHLIKEQEKVEEQRKQSLCRFFVRGLCIFSKEECRFSHGINDLDYQEWNGEPIEYDYLKETDFTQRKAVRGPRIYVNLYEFQTVKKYTLEQLNQNRQYRTEIRSAMHQKLFQDFIALIEERLPGANLTEDLLIREYTRVGFNKLMTRIKFSHLTSYLCEAENSLYFKKSIVMPPLVKKQTTYLFRRASEEENLAVYRAQYERILKESEKPLEESILKKAMFQISFPNHNIVPINILLKQKKMAFSSFLEVLSGGSLQDCQNKVKLELTPEEMLPMVLQYLKKQNKKIVSWSDVFNFLCKELKMNNGNIINQVRPMLALQGYQFLSFPMIQLIYHESCQFPFAQQAKQLCPCPYQQLFDITDLPLGEGVHLELGASVDINDLESLLAFAPQILNSKVLGVDLEGNLRRGGFVQMVQLNNGRNTFLIDIFCMLNNGESQVFSLAQRVLRNVLANPNILKIFHDCRHDSLALHEFIRTCVRNVFDTSAVQTLIGQFQNYQSLWKVKDHKLSKAKQVLTECANVRSAGLNDILLRYKASHGVNQHKDRFHKMWSKGEINFFNHRPLHPDYREYCIKDVLDLPEVHLRMQAALPSEMLQFANWVSSNYAYYGYLSTTEGQSLKQ